MASAVARAYNGGLGAEPPAGVQGQSPRWGSGGRSPPEAGKLWLLASTGGSKLAYFLYLENDNNKVHSTKD